MSEAGLTEGRAPVVETPEQVFERDLVEDPKAAYHQALGRIVDARAAGTLDPADPWTERMDKAWVAFATDMVGREVPPGYDPAKGLTHEQMVFLTDMEGLHNSAMFRSDAYPSKEPSELSRQIAEKTIETEAVYGRGGFAPRIAAEANLSPQRQVEIRRQYAPTLRDSIVARLRPQPASTPTSGS